MCLLVLSAASPAGAALEREPYLQLASPTSITVVWRTTSSSDSRVLYGTALGALDQQVTDATVDTDHAVTLTGLTPGQKYFYAVGSTTTIEAGEDPNHYFRTPPPVGSTVPFTAWIVGDSGTGGANQAQVRDAMLLHTGLDPPDVYLHLGDIAYDTGTQQEYTDKHFAVYAPILRHTPFWPTRGNHDGATGYYDAFYLPTAGESGGEPSGTEAYYSFEYGQVHFVVLDSFGSDMSPGSPMLQWLANDLAATTQEWVIAYFHHPPYSAGSHDSQDSSDSSGRLLAARENVLPILEAGGVDLVFSGHSHGYERSYLIDQAYGYGVAPDFQTPDFNTLLGLGHILDAGDGSAQGDGVYVKSPGVVANDGAVYVVAGHGGRTITTPGLHPVMVFSEGALGSLLVTVEDNLLTAENLRFDGVVSDTFSIAKGTPPPPCATDADCDDGIACTDDLCNGQDGCSNPSNCAGGQVCNPNSEGCEVQTSVSLQNGVDGYQGTRDTVLREDKPTEPRGSEPEIEWDSESPNGSNRPVYGLLAFDDLVGIEYGKIPLGSTISSATLHLEMFNASSSPAGAIHESAVDWDEGTTWNTFGGDPGVQAGELGAFVADAPIGPAGPVSVDVTASVQAWIDDPASNRGWVIVPADTDKAEVHSAQSLPFGLRPRLDVDFVPSTCASDADCDDGLACNGTETCVGSFCTAGVPVVCDDGVACTSDACDEGTGACSNTPDDGACDDGQWCTGSETCHALLDCQPGPDPCVGLSCDEAADVCIPLEVRFEEVASGTDTNTSSVATSGALIAATDDLYVAAVSYRENVGVSGVSGLGLTWNEASTQCSGRNNTGVSVWWAQGTPSSGGPVSASLAGSASAAVISAARYSGVHPSAPIGNVTSGNSNGAAGSCSGGSDDNNYSFDLAIGEDGALVFGAAALRSRSHSAGSGYTERDEISAGSAGDVAGVAIQDQASVLTGTEPVAGSFSNSLDYAVVGIEIRPAPSGGCVTDSDCDDGAFCNGAESCQAGVCIAGSPVVCDDAIACTVDVCDEATDVCQALEDDAACDDGQYCNGAETCNAVSGCEAATAVACDDGVGCTLDACDEAADACTFTPDDAACDDGLFCNGGESCDALLDCQTGSDPCAGQLCDEVGDACESCSVDADCDDAVFCNGTELCLAGACVPGSPIDCDDGVGCTVDSCDEATDACANAPSDAACDNGLYCDGTETCDVLLDCQAGVAVDCDDGVGCTADTCDEGADACANAPDDAACDNGLFCDGVESCHSVLDCQAGADPCLGAACDEAGDLCQSFDITLEEVETGGSTSSSSVATDASLTAAPGELYLAAISHRPDAVVTGVAGLGLAWSKVGTQCSGRNQTGVAIWMAQGSPSGSGAVTASFQTSTLSAVVAVARYSGVSQVAPIGSSVGANSNGEGGSCSGGSDASNYSLDLPIQTSDAVAFSAVAMRNRSHTAGSGYTEQAEVRAGSGGNEASTALQDASVPSAATVAVDGSFGANADWAALALEIRPFQPGECGSDAECSDGLFCNGQELCQSGVCIAGAPIDCDDGVACTNDICFEAGDTCLNVTDDSNCSNGTFCDGAETCDAVAGCLAGSPPCPGSCDEVADTCSTCEVDADCADGVFCNGAESCQGGFCFPASPVDCDDGVACTVDSCDEVADVCANAPDDSACDDGLFCNGSESCDPLLDCQSGAPVDCDDGVGCTSDTCDEGLDACGNAPNDALCSDGLFCNGAETCSPVLDCQAGGDPCLGQACDEVGDFCPSLEVTLEEVSTGTATSSSSVATDAPLTAAQGEVYVAAISYRPIAAVTGVSGLGLTWNEALTQCSGRGQTGVSVWWAQGDPTGDDVVTADLDLSAASAAIAVSRYSGVSTTGAVGNVVGANSNGPGGGCSGGSDGSSYSVSLEVQDSDGIAYGAAALRNRSHTPGAGYTEQAELQAGSLGDVTGLAVEDRSVASPQTLAVDGSLSASTDWAAVGVELRPFVPGACVNDADCSDGVFCNGAEVCQAGTCTAGAPVDCDDGIACTTDACDEAVDACAHVEDDTACDNGVFCDGPETCHPTLDCQAGSVPCDAGETCDEVGDTCVAPPVCNVDADCDDGLHCNGAETCQAGACLAGTAVDCDDGVSCTVDACNETTDSCDQVPDDASCDDGLYCNGAETCDPLADCQAGVPVDCDDGVLCTVDACDEAADACQNALDDASCDDGVFCNGAEACDPLLDCQAGGDPCAGLVCDEGTDSCETVEVAFEEVASGTSTGSTSVSTSSISAAAGHLYLAAVTYRDNVGVDSVSGLGLAWTEVATQCSGRGQTATSVWRALGTPSSAGPVTANLAGSALSAVITVVRYSDVDPGDPIGAIVSGNTNGPGGGCSGGSDSNAYSLDLDVASDGALVFGAAALRAETHSPGSGFTERDEVETGSGGGTAGLAVQDRSGLTPGTVAVDGALSKNVDWAVVGLEVRPRPPGACVQDTECSDGAFCNGVETCQAFQCAPGVPVDCGDGVGCTVDACDEATDACTHAPDDSACDDALFCTGSETCDVLLDCQSGGDPCGGLTCDEPSQTCGGCTSDAQCSDGVFCNGAETCQAGTCTPGNPPDCGDGIGCTLDACDEAGATCTNTPDDLACDNGLVCDGVETCDALLDCLPGAPVVCDDGIPCTVDSCSEAGGTCLFTPDDAFCDDGLSCNGGETCDPVAGCVDFGGAPPDPNQTLQDPIDVSLVRTTASMPGDADDPAIWIHPSDPSQSLIIGTDKSNGIYVYDLSGAQLQHLPQGAATNNVDVRQGVAWGGGTADVVAWNIRGAGKLGVALVDPNTVPPTLVQIAGASDSGNDIQSDSYGFGLHRDPTTGVLYVFDRPKSGGQLQQYRVEESGGGALVTPVRTLVYSGGTAEGFVADDQLGFLYAGEEAVGIHKYLVSPTADPNPIALFATDDGIAGDREGIALYQIGSAAGYLVLSSQGNSTVKVYDRVTNAYVTTIDTLDTLGTDGLDVTSAALPDFPNGFLIPHDQGDARFELYDWSDVMAGGLAGGNTLPPEAECQTDADCSDGVFCNGQESCDSGCCVAGSAPGCDDGVACTADTCDAGLDACLSLPDDAACDDGLFCTGAETCDVVLGCQSPGEPCGPLSCDEGSDACSACTSDAECSDGLFCNGAETCQAGACVAGIPVDCDDGIGCTTDACDEAGGACAHVANDAACSDGLFCNGAETCDPALDCQAGGDPCPGLSCDEIGDSCENLEVVFEGIVSGGDTSTTSVTTSGDVTAAEGDLYLASISTRDKLDVDSVSGLGLGWTELVSQCSGRDQTGVSVWWAQGTPTGDGPVSAALSGNANAAVIEVARYSGVSSIAPIGAVVSGNSNGAGGGCSGGSDSSVYSIDLDVSTGGAIAYGTAAMRNRAHTPGNGFTERDEVSAGSAGSMAGLAVQDRSATAAGTIAVSGFFNGSVDYAVAAVEILPFTPGACAVDADCDDGAFCNGTELCADGTCQAGAPVNCDDGVSCTQDGCDEAADACSNVPDDTACTDGLFCNGTETCDAALDCQPGADPCGGETCDEATDTCSSCTTDADCQDGLFCNGAESCQAGACVPGAPVVCDDGVGCTADACDEATDACSATANDAACSDGIFCNGAETCDAALGCQAAAAVDCDDGVGCTADACDEAADACAHVPDDGACDDGLFCDGAETCHATLDCISGPAPCAAEFCDEAGDLCAAPPVTFEEIAVGTVESSSTISSSTLTAVEGDLYLAAVSYRSNVGVQGVSGLGLTWSEVATQCSARNVTGVSVWRATGTPSGDGAVTVQLASNAASAVLSVARYSGTQASSIGNVVSANSLGVGGACSGGSDSASYSFDIDVTDAGSIVYAAAALRSRQHTPGAAYLERVELHAGSLGNISGVAVEDQSPPGPGTVTVDGTFSSAVDHAEVAIEIRPAVVLDCTTDSDCDDGLTCNGAEACAAGTCVAGTPVVCDDGIACTLDACDEATAGCSYTPDDAACDDGVFCNGAETCDPTLDCQPGPPVACDDGVGCTADACDESSDACTSTPDDAACDDGLFCNGAEICDPALDCQAGPSVVCDDGVGCTADACDEVADACTSSPDHAACDDGLFCNGTETCDPTLDCQSGTAIACDDGVGCTADACDEGSDACTNTPDDAACDDGLFCNGAETCDPTLDCQSGTAIACDDGVGCTADACDEASDACVHTPTDAVCDNGVWCDGIEVCDAALDCQPGTAVSCDDGIGCTADSCVEATQSCSNAPSCPASLQCSLDSGTCESPASPIFFRDDLDGYAGTRDATLLESSAGSNTGSSASYSWVETGGGDEFALIRFDEIFGPLLGQIPVGATIHSATLRFVVYDGGVGAKARLHESLVSWDEATVTWQNFGGDAGVQANEQGADIDSVPNDTGTAVLDVTASVQAWANDPQSNFGWIIVPRSSSQVQARSSEYSTQAARPSLEIDFTP